MTLIINQAQTDEDIAQVKALFLAYLEFIEGYLGQNLDFQNTQEEFETFPDMYRALFLARLDGEAVGACGLKTFAPSISELKRLYVLPQGRGHNLGERLTRAAIEYSAKNAFEKIYLDTDPGLTHANAIYERLGFTDIERYYENPMGCSRYMALRLEAR
jgi:carbonic anhydrase